MSITNMICNGTARYKSNGQNQRTCRRSRRQTTSSGQSPEKAERASWTSVLVYDSVTVNRRSIKAPSLILLVYLPYNPINPLHDNWWRNSALKEPYMISSGTWSPSVLIWLSLQLLVSSLFLPDPKENIVLRILYQKTVFSPRSRQVELILAYMLVTR